MHRCLAREAPGTLLFCTRPTGDNDHETHHRPARRAGCRRAGGLRQHPRRTGRAQRDHRAHRLRRTAHHRARRAIAGLRRGLRLRAGQPVHDRRPTGDRARTAQPPLRPQDHRAAGPALPAQRADRPVHRRAHGRRRPGARLAPNQRRNPGPGARLCGGLQPLPGRPWRPTARGLPGQALGAAHDAGRIPPHGRDHGRAGRRCRTGRWPAGRAAAAARSQGRAGQHPAGGPGRRRPGHARAGPARFAPGLQCLGLWQGGDRQRQRHAAGQPALSVERAQPLLPTAPHHSGPDRCDGRGHWPLPHGVHRLQQGRGLVAHRVHRQALHAVRAATGRGRPHHLPGGRQAREDDIAHHRRAHAVVHPLGAAGGHPTRGPDLERPNRLRPARRQRRQHPHDGRRPGLCARPLGGGHAPGARRPGPALGQHPGRRPPRPRAVRRRERGARCGRGTTRTLHAQQARRRAAHGRRAGGAQWRAGRLRLATRPPLARAGADPHRAHAHRPAHRLGAQQQRQLLLHPPGAKVRRHLAPGGRRPPDAPPHPRRPGRNPRNAGPGQGHAAGHAGATVPEPQLHGLGHRARPARRLCPGTQQRSARRLRRPAGLEPAQRGGRARRPCVPRVLAQCAQHSGRVPRALRPPTARRHPGRAEDGRCRRGSQGLGCAGDRGQGHQGRRLCARCPAGQRAAPSHHRGAHCAARGRRV